MLNVRNNKGWANANKGIKNLGFAVMIMALAGCASGTSSSSEADLVFEDVNTEQVTTIALGDGNTPAGIYAQEIFTTLGIWDEIQSKISYGTNVKAVLAQVEQGSVDCGIVYATDAASVDDVIVTDIADSDDLASVVSYPVAITDNSATDEVATVFMTYLQGEAAKEEFEAAGFTVTGALVNEDLSYSDEATLTIFAAASLTDALSSVRESFEAAYPNIDVEISFNSSGTLQTQIEQGAECDIFFSAAQKQMTALIDGGYIEESTKIDLLENKVVLIVPAQ